MNVRQIKEQYTCLDYLGEPLKRTKHGWIYRTPWRTDVHPSLSVTLDGKGWHDLATGAHGNIIDLVMADLNTRDLSRVCAAFDSFSFFSTKTFDLQKEIELNAGGFTSFEVMPLQSRGLYAYLYQRKIDIPIAKQFLMEAHYSFKTREDGRYLYALAYANDKGGYELRSSHYKGGTSPKGITTHLDQGNASVVVFEGFFDMLSFATLCGGVNHDYVILNSIVNAPAAIDILCSYAGVIYLCLDNDEAGRETTRRMLDMLPLAIDISPRYAPYKDVNDYLRSKNMQKTTFK